MTDNPALTETACPEHAVHRCPPVAARVLAAAAMSLMILYPVLAETQP
jgi:hypothetical protein